MEEKSIGFVKKRLQNGFTLLEIMAAVAIIAITLVGVYQLYGQSIRLSGAANFYATSSLLSRKLLGEIDGKSQDDIFDDSGDFGDDFPGYEYRVEIEEVLSDAFDLEGAKIKKIELEITRNEDENVYNLRTYRFVRDKN